MVRIVFISCVLVASASLRAADAAKQFDDLFGEEVKRVQATPDTKDDVELAQSLIAAAEKSDADPALKQLLCEQASALAMKSSTGAETAVKALQMLADASPERRLESLQHIAELRQKQFMAAKGDERITACETVIAAQLAVAAELERREDFDAAVLQLRKSSALAAGNKSASRDRVKGELDRVLAGQKVYKQIDAAKAKLKENNKDNAAAEELLRLYVVERDDPAEARKYSFLVTDEALSANIKRANTPVEQLTEQDCFEMGEWYRSLGDQTKSPFSHAAMLRRAVDYYAAFLQTHATEDLMQTKATLAKSKSMDEIAALEKETSGAAAARGGSLSRWIDLVAAVDLNRGEHRGRWSRKDGVLTGEGDGTARGAAVAPAALLVDGSYEMAVKLVLTNGHSVVLLPVGHAIAGILLQGERKTGLGVSLERLSESDPKATVRTRIEADSRGEYVIEIKVQLKKDKDEATIVVNVNGQAAISWSGPTSRLMPLPWLHIGRDGQPEITSGLSLAVHSWKLRMTDGKATPIDAGKVEDKKASDQKKLDDIRSRMETGLKKMERMTDAERQRALVDIKSDWEKLPEGDRQRVSEDLIRNASPDLRRLLIEAFRRGA
jgi:hypothetical protein